MKLKPKTRYVLSLLRDRGAAGMTELECIRVRGGTRLSARVYELRAAGFEVETHWEGRGDTRYARYVLVEQISAGLVA